MMIESPATGSQAPTPKLKENSRRSNFLLTLPFILIFLVQLYHHQMWRDELNVWGIALASPTLSMLAHYIHFEGHPGLWYYLVWFPSRIWIHPAAMKGLEAIIGIGIYLFIGLGAPWTRFEKILVFLSYFISFEYTVISRTYGLCLLIALAYIYLRTRRPQAVASCAALLGLMANTDMIGVILSGALLIEYSWERISADRDLHIKPTLTLIKLWSIYLAFLLVSYLTLKPAKEISWITTGRFGSFLKDWLHLYLSIDSNLGLPWFPFSMHYPHKYWNPSPLLHLRFFLVISIVATTAVYIVFRKSPRLLTLVGLTMLGAILFAHLIYLGYMRHFGVVFLAFLLAYWIKRSKDLKPSRVALALLVVNALAGIAAGAAAWTHPFSNAQNAANWLVAHHLENQPMAGYLDMMSVGVAENLNKPIYFPQCNCTDTFMLFSRRRDDMDDSHLAYHLRRADQDMRTNQYTLIMQKPMSPEQYQEITADHQKVTLLAQFTDAEELAENFWLYNVARQP